MEQKPALTANICKDCNGTGKILECQECDGEGEVHWESDSGHEYSDTCAVCDGSGKINASHAGATKCDCCLGTGKTCKDISIILNGKIFTSRLLNKINAIPSAKIYLDFQNPEDGYPPVPFIFDGGEGIIMQRISP